MGLVKPFMNLTQRILKSLIINHSEEYHHLILIIFIKFPLKISGISKFEKQNYCLSIIVFGWNKFLYPIYISKKTVGRPIELLLTNDKDDPLKNQYIWIEDLARTQLRNSRCEHRKHPSLQCLHVLANKNLLKLHVEDCKDISKKGQRM